VDTTLREPRPRIRLAWGRRGAAEAAARGEILVVVDVLSFCSTVATAVHYGGLVYPCGPEEDAAALARRVGGEAAVSRRDTPREGRFSLSPLTCIGLEPASIFMIPFR
jgi:2-phosphosulfolactate phosphatase